jgi:hypothetical protein
MLTTVLVAGYDTASTIPGVVYRTETFPGLGFLLKKAFYTKVMEGKMADCCSNRFRCMLLSS